MFYVILADSVLLTNQSYENTNLVRTALFQVHHEDRCFAFGLLGICSLFGLLAIIAFSSIENIWKLLKCNDIFCKSKGLFDFELFFENKVF